MKRDISEFTRDLGGSRKMNPVRVLRAVKSADFFVAWSALKHGPCLRF